MYVNVQEPSMTWDIDFLQPVSYMCGGPEIIQRCVFPADPY